MRYKNRNNNLTRQGSRGTTKTEETTSKPIPSLSNKATRTSTCSLNPQEYLLTVISFSNLNKPKLRWPFSAELLIGQTGSKNRPENRDNFLTPLQKVLRLWQRCSPNPRTPWLKENLYVNGSTKSFGTFRPKFLKPLLRWKSKKSIFWGRRARTRGPYRKIHAYTFERGMRGTFSAF